VHFRMAQVPRTGQVQLFFKDPAGNGVELNFADAQA
jgi:catechol-2,3-dioxygenase